MSFYQKINLYMLLYLIAYLAFGAALLFVIILLLSLYNNQDMIAFAFSAFLGLLLSSYLLVYLPYLFECKTSKNELFVCSFFSFLVDPKYNLYCLYWICPFSSEMKRQLNTISNSYTSQKYYLHSLFYRLCKSSNEYSECAMKQNAHKIFNKNDNPYIEAMFCGGDIMFIYDKVTHEELGVSICKHPVIIYSDNTLKDLKEYEYINKHYNENDYKNYKYIYWDEMAEV